MAYTKNDIISRLSKTHDNIKRHPFRDNFAAEHISDYKYLLSELTDIWCDYIYRGEHESETEQALLRQFGYWIHDYRANLRTWVKHEFPMSYFDYYERMLQVTHNFIKTGELFEFYNIDCVWKNGIRRDNVEHYKLITKEMCGIDSPILPRYFPVNFSMQDDEELIQRYLEKDGYPYYNWAADKRQEFFEQWKVNVKPVLNWLNSQHDETEFKHGTWMSVKAIS